MFRPATDSRVTVDYDTYGTATANPTPILIEKTNGIYMGEGNKDGSWKEEEYWDEWHDNGNNTISKKIVVRISKHTIKEDNIHICKTISETISKEEYFKRKLAGTI